MKVCVARYLRKASGASLAQIDTDSGSDRSTSTVDTNRPNSSLGGGSPRSSGVAGEVLIRIRGGLETFLAWSDTELPKGTTVLVVETRGRRTVDVVAWDVSDPAF